MNTPTSNTDCIRPFESGRRAAAAFLKDWQDAGRVENWLITRPAAHPLRPSLRRAPTRAKCDASLSTARRVCTESRRAFSGRGEC
jgi:hypothetical protein